MKMKNRKKADQEQKRHEEDEEEEKDEKAQQQQQSVDSNSCMLSAEGYLKLAYMIPERYQMRFVEDNQHSPSQIYNAGNVVLAVQIADRSEHTSIAYGPHRLRKRHLFGHNRM